MRRLHGSDAPLMHGHAGVSAHTDLAVAPPLTGDPLDEVIAVLAVLMCEHMHVALGMTGAADVDVGDRITLVAPVQRVRGLEFGKAGYCVRRHAHDLPLAHAFARTFAEPGPGNDDRVQL